VCEANLPPGPSNREVCWRASCRAERRKSPQTYRWSGIVKRPPRSARNTGLKIGTKGDRPLRIIAGPAPAEINLRPLQPKLAARLDRDSAEYLEARRKAAWHAARAAQIKRRHPPVNVLGGYRFPDAPAIDMSPIEPPPEWAIPSRWKPTGDGAGLEDIPEFLRRDPARATRIMVEAA
jgi:hypothetical protein